MYISLYDIGLFIIFTILIVVCSYLVLVLHRTFCVLGSVKQILDGHNEEIEQTIAGLPETLANVNQLAISLKETADQANGAFGSLQHNITDTVDDLRDGMEDIIVYGKVAAEVFKTIFSKNS